jgi:hypothetical protein
MKTFSTIGFLTIDRSKNFVVKEFGESGIADGEG